MTVDTTAIQTSVTTFINSALGYLPLGIAIIGIPSGIVIGLAFAGRIVSMVKSALGGGGR